MKDELTKKNLVRTLSEMTVLNTMAFVAYAMLKEAGDDDEDSYLFKMSTYMMMRTTNEVASATVGLPKQLYETLENTIVGLNTTQALTEFPSVLSGDIVERGRYRGMTERERYFAKHVPLMKEYNNLTNMDGTIDTYKYFNLEKDGGNLKWTVYAYLRAIGAE